MIEIGTCDIPQVPDCHIESKFVVGRTRPRTGRFFDLRHPIHRTIELSGGSKKPTPLPYKPRTNRRLNSACATTSVALVIKESPSDFEGAVARNCFALKEERSTP